MEATAKLIAIRIKENKYSKERVPSWLADKVHEQLELLERDEQQNG